MDVEIGRVSRSKDEGGNWDRKIEAARRKGVDAIVYLNRYEGLQTEVIGRLMASGDLSRLDRLTDKEFRRLVPEARDSLIILSQESIRLKSIRSKLDPGSHIDGSSIKAARKVQSEIRGDGFNQCHQASRAFSLELESMGVSSCILRLDGCRKEYPNPNDSWQEISREFWVHYVVEIGDFVFDLTRRQFDPGAGGIHISRSSDVENEWDHVSVVEVYGPSDDCEADSPTP